MRALSVRAPWWWFILHGGKDIENREWFTHQRGLVYLHAGKTMPKEETKDELELASRISGLRASALPTVEQLAAARGCLVGSVEVVDCVRSSSSPWFFGTYGFVLRNPIAFKEPVPCKGSRGWFDVPVVAESQTCLRDESRLF